jgi:hypothetical protein
MCALKDTRHVHGAWLLRLYPSAWRVRYQDEFCALLAQRPPGARDLVDILFGALDARLRSDLVTGRGIPMARRIRQSEIAIFLSFVVFGVAMLGIARLPDPLATWDAATRSHPELAVLFNAIVGFALLAGLGMIAGGVPVFLSTLKHSWIERRRDILALLGGAVLLGIVFAVYSAVVAVNISARPGTGVRPLRPLDVVLTLIWLALFLLGVVVIPLCVSLAVARGPNSDRVARFALGPATVVTLSMGAAWLATILLGALIYAEAPSLITGEMSQDVGWRILLIVIVLMALGTVLAGRALRQGLQARAAFA